MYCIFLALLVIMVQVLAHVNTCTHSQQILPGFVSELARLLGWISSGVPFHFRFSFLPYPPSLCAYKP